MFITSYTEKIQWDYIIASKYFPPPLPKLEGASYRQKPMEVLDLEQPAPAQHHIVSALLIHGWF